MAIFLHAIELCGTQCIRATRALKLGSSFVDFELFIAFHLSPLFPCRIAELRWLTWRLLEVNHLRVNHELLESFPSYQKILFKRYLGLLPYNLGLNFGYFSHILHVLHFTVNYEVPLWPFAKTCKFLKDPSRSINSINNPRFSHDLHQQKNPP